MFPETLFPVSVLVSKMQFTAGNFDENPSMRAFAKILRARTKEHSSNFCEQFEQRPNLASTFKLNGTIQYPWMLVCRGVMKEYGVQKGSLGIFTIIQSSMQFFCKG